MFGFGKKEQVAKNELRMLSDHDIVSEIIDLSVAKSNYSDSKYKRFYNKYLEYSTNNEKFPTYNSRYKDRVLTMTYEFAVEGLDVSKICRENSEALNIFNNGQEKLEDDAYEIIEKFSEAIDSVAEDNDLNWAICRGFGWALLHYSLKFINDTENLKCATDRLPCMFRAADNMYLKFLFDTYYEKDDPWLNNALESTKKAMFNKFQEIIDNESVIEYCLEKFVKSYMVAVGAQNDTNNFEKLKNIVVVNWHFIVLKHKVDYKQ